MKALQFAWVYLIQNGVAECEHGKYGGYKFTNRSEKMLEAHKQNIERLKKQGHKVEFDHLRVHDAVNSAAIAEMKEHGVDWSKTKAPHSDTISVFNGTFADAGHKETLRGTLVLKNGAKQLWIAEALEVSNVFELMEHASEAETKFKELFGEE